MYQLHLDVIAVPYTIISLPTLLYEGLKCMSCCSSRANRVSYAEDYDSELDSDPDDAKKKSKANVAVALMDTTEEMDDEVERILGHRLVRLPQLPRCVRLQHGAKH